jgi:hypothetical protein
MPQQDLAIKKVVALRKKDEFSLDYSLKYALQKYFLQVIDNQLKLELAYKFAFPKQVREDKIKAKRLEISGIKDFLRAHGRYPDDRIAQLIVRELNLNKGDCKRNKSISEFICEYNENHKRKEPLPEVVHKDPVVIASSRKDLSKTDGK